MNKTVIATLGFLTNLAAALSLALWPAVAHAAHPRLIGGTEVLLDDVDGSADAADVEIVVLAPKDRCAPPPQPGWRIPGLGPSYDHEKWTQQAGLWLACGAVPSWASRHGKLNVRLIERDASGPSAIADALALGLFDNPRAKRVLLIRWEFYVSWRGPGARYEDGWLTAEVLGFDTATRRLVWHALQRSEARNISNAYGMAFDFEFGVSFLLSDAFHNMNTWGRRDGANRLGARWLAAPETGRTVDQSASRLFLVARGNKLGSSALICPRDDDSAFRQPALCKLTRDSVRDARRHRPSAGSLYGGCGKFGRRQPGRPGAGRGRHRRGEVGRSPVVQHANCPNRGSGGHRRHVEGVASRTLPDRRAPA